ncbi:restriction endonuclease, SacI family [Jiella sp. MQZ9-1]|uniref:Restriction endonuclease, SacI family n=1 Tax=Jiella flava TaxID=2816857 RepID=A0A939FWI9_9HYPH|nr:restriction endonuclease, SacI family [Jiella flava]MBO0662817.1 restriction endonuclease, SacI family [Jiella flava]MCD2471422.1 restriction endonuclease, SacI family [Jiella flava]
MEALHPVPDAVTALEKIAGWFDDRKYPGDVCVCAAGNPTAWDKAIEVRDKPVAAFDVQIFGKKCIDMGVLEAAVVMVSDRQPALDMGRISRSGRPASA